MEKSSQVIVIAGLIIGVLLGVLILSITNDNGDTVERRVYKNGEYEVFYGTRSEAVDYAVQTGADSIVHIYKQNK